MAVCSKLDCQDGVLRQLPNCSMACRKVNHACLDGLKIAHYRSNSM